MTQLSKWLLVFGKYRQEADKNMKQTANMSFHKFHSFYQIIQRDSPLISGIDIQKNRIEI